MRALHLLLLAACLPLGCGNQPKPQAVAKPQAAKPQPTDAKPQATVKSQAAKSQPSTTRTASAVTIEQAKALYEKGLDLQQRQGKVEEAIAVFYQAIQADYPPAINHFAWLRATSPLAKYRNGAEAVKLSERACRLSARPEEPSKFGSDCLDTLASAYAEAGMWDKAVEAAKRAIAMAEEVNNRAGVREFTTRLEMFQKKQPYRDEQ